MMNELYIFDLDGTLADCSHRLHLLPKDRHEADGARRNEMYREFYAACDKDSPILPITSICLAIKNGSSGSDVVVWTGRSDEVRGQTLRWLRQHVGWFWENDLKMRTVGDHRPDAVLKAEWYHALSDGDKRRLVAVFEDRERVVKMWRDLGVTCLQVDDGKF